MNDPSPRWWTSWEKRGRKMGLEQNRSPLITFVAGKSQQAVTSRPVARTTQQGHASDPVGPGQDAEFPKTFNL